MPSDTHRPISTPDSDAFGRIAPANDFICDARPEPCDLGDSDATQVNEILRLDESPR